MRTKSGLVGGLLAVLICSLLSCSDSNSATTSSGTAVLYLTTEGNSSIQSFTVNQGSGALSTLGSEVSTGSSPTAIAIAPSLSTLFVSNSASNNISSYTVNSDGSLAAVSGATNAGTTPTGLAIDPAGDFLFVANQGSNDVSVFAIDGSSLSEVAGSPFTTIPAGTTDPTGPMSVAVSGSGHFLYVANRFTNNVSVFSVASTGVLNPIGGSPYVAGTNPSGLAITPSGAFLYVANAGSNDVSAFFICDQVVTNCADANHPDGTLTPVTGSPFPAGLRPVAVAVDPSFDFLYVLDKGSSQVSEYSFASGTGVLSPLANPVVSTGTTPISLVVIAGATGSNAGNTTTNPTDYIYVANNGSSSLSAFSLTTATGILVPLNQAIVTTANPSAVAAN